MFRLAFKYFGYRYRQHKRKTNEKVIVETVYGPVRGVKRISCWDDPYYSFEKIPFAKPPVGELRFTEPEPPEPWVSILDCTNEAPKAVQTFPIYGIAQGSEDCLYISVFTKQINPPKLLPVMVWIHGGGFVMLSTSKDFFSPDYFMSKDVVVVSVAYRLGLFGFLSLKDPSLKVPGNAGLKDQVLGLKWVQKNIEKFGGDPDNVTIFGSSAGGASVHYLTLTEQAKGLFHKAILMSGTSLCPWAIAQQRDWPYRIAKQLGYNGEHEDAPILEFLRSANCNKISQVEAKILTKEEKYEGIIWCSAPVIEPYVTEQCVIPKEPVLMAREAWSNSTIPMIIGGTSREGMFVVTFIKNDASILKEWEKDSTLMLPIDLQLERNSDRCVEFGQRLREEFFGDEEITLKPYIDISSYKIFWHGIHRAVESRLKYATAPTYYYIFDKESHDLSMMSQFYTISPDITGVPHGGDAGFIFVNMLTKECKKDMVEYKTVKQMIGMWTQFAVEGDPNCEEIAPVQWKPISSEEKPSKCLNISDEITLIENPFSEKLKVFDSLYPDDKLI